MNGRTISWMKGERQVLPLCEANNVVENDLRVPIDASRRPQSVSWMGGSELFVETMNMIHFSLETAEEKIASDACIALLSKRTESSRETGK